MTFKLGKAPARPWQAQGNTFRFAAYLAPKPELPPLPATFGHYSLVAKWGMLGNDNYGDCVWAGAAHETMLWARAAGREVGFTDANVLSDYGSTGFRADDPATDQGTDVQVAADYRRKTGIIDAAGKRHRVAAFLRLEPGNIENLLLASYLFGAVGIGVQLPQSALDQSYKGQMWDVVAGSPIEGGHYVPLVGRLTNLVTVSWGQAQLMTEAFLKTYCDEAVAYVSAEALINQKSPEGFDYTQLIADLDALG